MAERDYDNWLISLDSDNFSSFIKVWFAYLATIHEIVFKSVDTEKEKQLLDDRRGDGEFLKDYRENHLPHISINESTKSSIIECYKISKAHIKNIYPKYFFVTYYKKIEDCCLYNKEFARIGRNIFYYDIQITNDYLHIGVLFDAKAPINSSLKNRYIDIKIPLIPPSTNLTLLENEEYFYKYILEESKSIFKQINISKTTKKYKEISNKLQNIFHFVINKARYDIYRLAYKEKFSESPTDAEVKEWFHEFSYSLRNVLFHRVVDPFDKNWTEIVKYASQALYDIVMLNIEMLQSIDKEEAQ